MHTHPHLLAVDVVRFQLGHVVGNVVDHTQIEPFDPAHQHLFKRFSGLMRQRLAIGPGEIGRSSHGRNVVLAFRRIDGRADKLAVGQDDAIAVDDALELLHVIGADLVAKAPRAAVDLQHHLAGKQAKSLGNFLVENLVDHIDFREMIARAQGSKLILASFLGPSADLVRPRPASSPPPRCG